MEYLQHILLFTGPPGVGKTTLVRSLANRFDSNTTAGFYTNEVRIDGRRQGFSVEIIPSGQAGLLASPSIASPVRFGTILPDGTRRLGVTLEFLENVACPTIAEPPGSTRLVVIDEIGPMQATSTRFREVVESLLQRQYVVLGTISDSDDPWISGIRNDTRTALFTICRSNRDILVDALALFLAKHFYLPASNNDAGQ